jgi:adenine deaminase
MEVLETWINGQKVYDREKVLFEYKPSNTVNKFHCSQINKDELSVKNTGSEIRIITAFDGDLSQKNSFMITGNGKFVESDTSEDILKIVVKDRYRDSAPAVAFIKGFGLKSGAFAGSVSHDSHNIIAIGCER